MSIAPIGVHKPQVNVPPNESALHIGNVLPVRGPHRHPNRDLRIVFEGNLATLLGFEIQYPKIAMSTTVAQVNEFMIPRGHGGRLHGAGLVGDLDAAVNIFHRTVINRVAPNIELDLPTGRDDVAVPIQVRRDVRRLAESELTQILSSGLDRPQIHGSQVENGIASGRAVNHSGAVGKPGKTGQRIPIPRDRLCAAAFGGNVEHIVIKGAAALESQFLVVRRPSQVGIGVFGGKGGDLARVRTVRICHS